MLIWVFGAIGLLMGGAIIGGMLSGLNVRAQKRAFEKDHPGWEAFVSPYDGNIVAISPDGRDVALGKSGDPVLNPSAHILSVEILRDDGMVLKPTE